MKSFQKLFAASKSEVKASEVSSTIKKARLAIDGKISEIDGEINKLKSELVDAEAQVDAIVLQPNYSVDLDIATQGGVESIKTSIKSLEAKKKTYASLRDARFPEGEEVTVSEEA